MRSLACLASVCGLALDLEMTTVRTQSTSLADLELVFM